MSKFIIRPGVNILSMLKDKGYSTYVIAKAKERTGEYILGQSTLTKLRKGGLPSWAELAKLVSLLHVSPVDLIAYQTDNGTVYDLTGQQIPTASAPTPTPAPEPAPPAVQTPIGEEYLNILLPVGMHYNERISEAVRNGAARSEKIFVMQALDMRLHEAEQMK